VRISVIVTPAEHAKIKRAAGLIPLSAYLKAAAMEKVAGESALAAKNGGGGRGAKVSK
jgi:hypothetical protein